MKNLRYAGYFLIGTVWLFVAMVPVLPLGILAFFGASKDTRKALASGLIILGMVAGFFGAGLYFSITPEGEKYEYAISPSLAFNLNAPMRYRNRLMFFLSGAPTAGRIVADKGIQCLVKGDVECFDSVFDESVSGVTQEALVSAVKTTAAAAGVIRNLRLVDIRYQFIKEKNLEIYQFAYLMDTEAGSLAVLLGTYKKNGNWQIITVTPARPKSEEAPPTKGTGGK